MDIQKVDEIIRRHEGDPSSLIAILLDVQEEYNYLPREAVEEVTGRLGVPLSRAYNVATFFKAFSLVPRGKHLIRVCLGTACHVKGGLKILEKFERDLNVKSGGTTEDLQFSLDAVNCLGCCGLAPVITADDDIYGKISLSKLSGITKKYSK